MMMDHKNLSDASASIRSLYRLVIISFGLLCLLQAALNISLRLGIYTCDAKMAENLETMNNNLTEERDTLKVYLAAVERDLEAVIENLTEETDMMKRKLNTSSWICFQNRLYYISSIKKSWHESREECLQRGADLVIINSKEEQDFMRQFMKQTWIGLTRNKTEGRWKWVDGTVLNTSFWEHGEPNNAGGVEYCGEIKNYEEEKNWNDASCENQSFWICEKTEPCNMPRRKYNSSSSSTSTSSSNGGLFDRYNFAYFSPF